jgi:hypothetical protein
LRRPVHLSLAAWRQSGEKVEESFLEVAQGEKPRAVAALALAQGAGALLVQASGKDYARKLGRELAARGLGVQVLWEAMREAEQERIREEFAEGRRPVLVSTFEAVRRHSLRWVTHVLNADPPPNREAYRPASVVLEKIITLGSAAQCRQLQERLDVKLEKVSLPDDEQVLAGAIGDILRRIRAEEDPAELARYLRLLRRHAPLGRRAAVAAYLLKQVYGALAPGRLPGAAAARGPLPARKSQAGAAGPQAGAVPGSRAAPGGGRAAAGIRAVPRSHAVPGLHRAAGPGQRRRGAAEKGTPPAERARAEAGFTRLFISVGKSRGVYPKDLAALFSDTLQVDRGRIGDIRVLDNYSFLEIDSALAEKAIAALSGSALKGKQITVNYARKKEDE